MKRILFLDSSVLVEFLLRDKPFMLKGAHSEDLMCSKLAEIEVHRALDRRFIEGKLTLNSFSEKLKEARWIFSMIRIIPLESEIIERAKESFPTPVKTLDALHLSTVLWLKEKHNVEPIFCTLDRQESLAAKALGFATQTEFAA